MSMLGGMQEIWPGFVFLVFPSRSYPVKGFEDSALESLSHANTWHLEMALNNKGPFVGDSETAANNLAFLGVKQ